MIAVRNKLDKELKKVEATEPEITIYVDSASLYWELDDGTFLYLDDHMDINEFLDENHKMERGGKPEGVGEIGVYWKNTDFICPFHISDIEERIETVNC